MSKYRTQYLKSSDLKTIMHSKRANLFYLEHCRVLQKDGRILYLTESKNELLYYNIPIANTTVILLGSGTSITQAAMRMLSKAGVMVGFCGNGGSPLFMGTQVEWFTPQAEYQPTAYVQAWMSWWWDKKKCFAVAQRLQIARLDFMQMVWSKSKEFRSIGFYHHNEQVVSLQNRYRVAFICQDSVSELLSVEGHMVRDLYKIAVKSTGMPHFKRDPMAQDAVNRFLNIGNALAYGLASTTLWVLGIPPAFAVLHGKTRRGALVFDIADLVKDAIVLPLAFLSARDQLSEREFRQVCLSYFTDYHVLDKMFDTVQMLALDQVDTVSE